MRRRTGRTARAHGTVGHRTARRIFAGQPGTACGGPRGPQRTRQPCGAAPTAPHAAGTAAPQAATAAPQGAPQTAASPAPQPQQAAPQHRNRNPAAAAPQTAGGRHCGGLRQPAPHTATEPQSLRRRPQPQHRRAPQRHRRPAPQTAPQPARRSPPQRRGPQHRKAPQPDRRRPQHRNAVLQRPQPRTRPQPPMRWVAVQMRGCGCGPDAAVRRRKIAVCAPIRPSGRRTARQDGWQPPHAAPAHPRCRHGRPCTAR